LYTIEAYYNDIASVPFFPMCFYLSIHIMNPKLSSSSWHRELWQAGMTSTDSP